MSYYFGIYDFRFLTTKTNNSVGVNDGKPNEGAKPNNGEANQGSNTDKQGEENSGNAEGGAGQVPPVAPSEKQNITVEKIEGGYDVKVDGNSAGVITIPNDKHLKNVTFEEDSKSLKFVLDVDGEQEVLVPLTVLSDEYQKGNGLELNDKTFSIKLSANTEPYLSVSEEGISLSGIDEKLGEKLSKEEADKLYAPLGSAPGGAISEEQLNNAIDGAKNELNQAIGEKANASDIKTYTAGNGLSLSDTEFSVSEEITSLPNKVQTLEGKVEVLEGSNFATTENVETAKQEAIADAESKYVKKSEEKQVTVESVGLVHTIKFGETVVGTINIPKDLFAKELEFDQASNMLKIKVNNADGDSEQEVSVDMSSLIDVYTAGEGLQLYTKEFSLTPEYTALPGKVQTLEGKGGEVSVKVQTLEGKVQALEEGKENAETKYGELESEIREVQQNYLRVTDAEDMYLPKSEAKNYSAGEGVEFNDTTISVSQDIRTKVALIDEKLDSSEAESTYLKIADVVEYTGSNGVRKVDNDFQLEEEYTELPNKVTTLENEKLSKTEAESTYAKKVDLEDIIRRLGVVEANYNTLNEKYTELQRKYEQVKGIADQNKLDIEELRQSGSIPPPPPPRPGGVNGDTDNLSA